MIMIASLMSLWLLSGDHYCNWIMIVYGFLVVILLPMYAVLHCLHSVGNKTITIEAQLTFQIIIYTRHDLADLWWPVNNFTSIIHICSDLHEILLQIDQMGQVMELQLSCYLVLLSIDSKTR